MYDIKWIRDNAAQFDEGRRRRGLEPLSAHLLSLDDTRRAAIGRAQAAQERRNAASKEIGAAMKAKDAEKAEALKAEVADLKNGMTALEERARSELGMIASNESFFQVVPGQVGAVAPVRAPRTRTAARPRP